MTAVHRRPLVAVPLVILVVGCGATSPAPAPPACPPAHADAKVGEVSPGAPSAEAAPPTTAVPAAPPAPLAPLAPVLLDGAPEVPPALLARLGQYLGTRSAEATSIAPDGARMLISTRFGATAQVHEVRAAGGTRRQLTFGSEPVADARYHPTDADSLIYRADVGGAENYQLYRLDRRTGRSALLTDGSHRHTEYAFSHDGRRFAYLSNARNQRDIDVWMGDGRAPGQLFLERSGDWHLREFSRDGAQLLLLEYVSIADTRVHVVDVAARTVRRISPEGAAADRDAAFDATGRRLYVASDRGREVVELYEVDLADPDRPWRPLSRAIPWNVEAMALSADGRTLVFATNEDGVSVLRLLDTRTRRVRVVAGTPRGVVTALVAARDAPAVAVSMVSATAPIDAYRLDLRTGRLERWTESEVGGLDPASLVEPTLFRYPSFDGREIPCFYYRPRGDGPFPVAVSIHGGPEAQARPWFSAMVQYLVTERRIAVLVPNVRGSDGYGKSYLALDDGRRREDSVRDIGALLDWIERQPALDRSRVAVVGGSYGGYMVLASLVHFGERLRGGVDGAGIANFVTFLENTAPYRRALRRVEYGDESDPDMRAFLTSISPATNADRIRSALFVAHGANDPRVPVGEAEQIVKAVRAGGHDVWYMLARNEGHGFVRKENTDLYTALAVLFLERHLGPAGAPD